MRSSLPALSILLMLVLAPLSAAAQPPERGRRPMAREPGERLEHLAEFLELSEAQAIEIEAILQDRRQARREHRASLRAAHQELDALVRADAPDATLIGEKVLAIHALKTSLRAEAEQHKEAIRGLLTAEQLERFEALEAARELQGDAGRGGRHGRRGHRGPRAFPGEDPPVAPDSQGG